MDAEKDFEIVDRLLPLRADKRRKSVLLRKSQVGRIGNKRFDLFFDAMPQRDFWHDHHGRPNYVLYANGLPLIVDTGCPNYDHYLRENYMTCSWAHNVPHVHEKPEHNIGEGYQGAAVLHALAVPTRTDGGPGREG
ncbi:MAG: heparinase II/III family protein [Planctomycetota bacterium]